MALLDTENGAQETRIRGSAHGVALKLAEQLGTPLSPIAGEAPHPATPDHCSPPHGGLTGEQVRLSSPVTSIHQTASDVAVTIQDGSSYTCHRVMYVGGR
jgi:hypothetical protein